MTDFLLLAFIFLAAGVIAVPIASRLGLGSVLGYLIAGIVISPVLGWLHVDVISIQHFAEFGVVMMLFLVGLELEPRALWDMRHRLMGLGGGQIGLTTLAIAGVALLLGQPLTYAVAIGLVLALSSTAIVLQTLNEKGLMRSDGGQLSFSVLLTQDIAVIPMLALLPLIAVPELSEALAHAADHGAGEGEHGGGMSLVDGLGGWQTTLVTLGAIAAVVGIGMFLTDPMFRLISAANLRELFIAGALLFVIGIALLMSLVGLSPALGTFLAGVVLANSRYRHELESDIDPFRGLLLGLFFMTVGAGINFTLLGANLGAVLALTLGLMLIKGLVLYLLARIFKLPGADKWLFTLGLAQAGEFGFVLLSFVVANAILPQPTADLLLLVVALSMLLTPLLFILYDRVIAPRYSQSQNRAADEMPEGNGIIIAGAGRVGGLVDRMLRAGGYAATVIDYNSKRLEILETFGLKHYFGDATRPDLLHAAGIEDASVFIVAIDDREQITEVVRYVAETHPKVHIVARAIDRDHVYDLYAAGSHDIIRETYDSTLRIGRSAFEALGLERAVAQEMIDVFNAMDRHALIEVAPTHEPGVPPHENEAYVQKVRELVPELQAKAEADMQAIRARAKDQRA